MARERKQEDYKVCLKCGENKKKVEKYYLSNSTNHADSRYPVCKDCLKENLNTDDMGSVKTLLLEMNRPFIYSLWESSIEEAKKTKRDVFGGYMKNMMLNFKTLTWKDTDDGIKKKDNESNDVQVSDKDSNQFMLTNEIILKWGDGYSTEEYRSFERKYNMFKNNYQKKTAMHTEALLTYIRYRVKEELATATNDSKSAKEWGTLAKDAATAAKINPSQLSKSDLSDGLDTFGQLVRTVEQAIDIIPILPKFKERPQDKVDFTLWCYINYIRDLKGLPLVEYDEIYQFYENRKKEYEDRMKEFENEVDENNDFI